MVYQTIKKIHNVREISVKENKVRITPIVGKPLEFSKDEISSLDITSGTRNPIFIQPKYDKIVLFLNYATCEVVEFSDYQGKRKAIYCQEE